MIQRIQSISFTGMQSKAADKAARKLEEAYVSASSILTGTVNAKKSARQLRDAKFMSDKDTLAGRVASLAVSKQNISKSEIAMSAIRAKEASVAAKANADMTDASAKISEFNFFG